MVEKLVKTARAKRNAWWEAFKLAGGVKGHQYYKIPAELKYRYPAPGSCPLDVEDHPNLFKLHWKTPFRNSHFNIRQKEVTESTAETIQHYIEGSVAVDPSVSEHERTLSLQQQPNTDDLKLSEEKDCAPDSDEMISELWEEFEGKAERMRLMSRDYAMGHWDLDE